MYLNMKFQMPSSNNSLVIAIKTKGRCKYRFHAAAMLVFYILREQKFYKQRLHIFQRSLTTLLFKTLYQVALVSLPPHKFVRPPCCYYRWYKVHKIFNQNASRGSLIEKWGHTDIHNSPNCVHTVRIMQRSTEITFFISFFGVDQCHLNSVSGWRAAVVTWTLWPWVRIPIEAWVFVRVFLCSAARVTGRSPFQGILTNV
jgi:hypothetical protein